MKTEMWNAIENPDVLNELGTDISKGLAEQKIEERLKKYGYNDRKKEEKAV